MNGTQNVFVSPTISTAQLAKITDKRPHALVQGDLLWLLKTGVTIPELEELCENDANSDLWIKLKTDLGAGRIWRRAIF